MDHAEAVARIDQMLKEKAKPQRAEFEKGYLKSSMLHYGVSLPDITKAAKWAGKMDHADALQLAQLLWDSPVHEHRMTAAAMLRFNEPRLQTSALPAVEKMLRESKTWALVDTLAIHVAGPLLERSPDSDQIVNGWAKDEDFWIRRSALLVHLKPLKVDQSLWPRFTELADSMLEEKEFFIRKAIGWVLRDVGRRHPDLVYSWILPRAGRASGVTIRETIKWLLPSQTAEVKQAYSSSASRLQKPGRSG